MRQAAILVAFTSLAIAAPDFPLYAILSDAREVGTPTTDDLYVIATNFTAIQGSFHDSSGSEDPSLFYPFSSSFRPMHYIATWASSNVLAFEGSPLRDGTLHYAAGLIATAVDSSTSTIHVNYASVHRSGWSVPASTWSGDISQSCEHFVSWIRVEGELMKILAVAGHSMTDIATLTVQRGFSGTTATAHESGQLAMAPVYNQNMYPGGPGCKNGDQLVYQTNPATAFGVAMVVNQSLEAIVGRNYSGVWLDCFSSQPFLAVDASGNHLRSLSLGEQPNGNQVWDTSSWPPKVFTGRQYRVREQQRLRRIWEAIAGASKAWPKPTIYANNLDTGHVWDDQGDGGGASRMLMRDQTIPAWPGNNTIVDAHPLDGYSNEAFALHEVGTCTWSIPEYLPLGQWQANVVMVQNLSVHGLSARPMAAQAGCKSPGLEKLSYQERDVFEGFAYASYLLTVNKSAAAGESTAFGIPAMYRRNVTAPNGTVVDVDFWAEVHPRYFLGLGEPVTRTAVGSLGGYQLFWEGGKPRNTLGRWFERGLVLVNPSNVTEGPLALNGTLREAGSGRLVSQVTVGGHGSLYLMK